MCACTCISIARLEQLCEWHVAAKLSLHALRNVAEHPLSRTCRHHLKRLRELPRNRCHTNVCSHTEITVVGPIVGQWLFGKTHRPLGVLCDKGLCAVRDCIDVVVDDGGNVRKLRESVDAGLEQPPGIV